MKNPYENLSPEAVAYRKQQIEALRKNKKIVSLLSQNKKNLKFLEDHSSILTDWLKNQETCYECVGLSNCAYAKKGIAGMSKELEFDEDGYMTEVLRPCRYRQEQEKRNAHLRNFWINHMDANGHLVNLPEISPAEPQAYINAAVTLLGSFDMKFGVYLYGQAGTGKSYLLSGLANEYAKADQSVCFVRFPRMISELKQNLADEQYKKELLWDLSHCDVLILDDIGSEAATPWTRDEILFPILDERMNQKKKTYFSSNLALENLINHYLFKYENDSEVAALRLMDRIKTLSMPVLLAGESRRIHPTNLGGVK